MDSLKFKIELVWWKYINALNTDLLERLVRYSILTFFNRSSTNHPCPLSPIRRKLFYLQAKDEPHLPGRDDWLTIDHADSWVDVSSSLAHILRTKISAGRAPLATTVSSYNPYLLSAIHTFCTFTIIVLYCKGGHSVHILWRHQGSTVLLQVHVAWYLCRQRSLVERRLPPCAPATIGLLFQT
jgi:hypothetical protein